KLNRAGSWSHLGGSNNLTIRLQRRRGSGAYTNVVADATGTTGTYGADVNSTGNDVTLSYDFRLYVVDTFDKSAESIISISTAKVLCDKHKDMGIGIGKLHERGALDVAGEAFFDGPVTMSHIVTLQEGHDGDFNTADKTGFYHMGSNALNSPSNTWGFLFTNSSSRKDPTDEILQVSQIFHERDGAQNMFSRAKTNGKWGPWRRISNGVRENMLWSGTLYMSASHTVTPAKSLSSCASGWMLQWSGYIDGTARGYDITYTFIPKNHDSLASGTKGVHQIVGVPGYSYKTKYLYVDDKTIKGNAKNSSD